MPALMAVIAGDADPLAREFAKTERMAIRAGRGIEAGIGGVSKMNSGVMRELLVLGREISYGNWTRVPGSLSILLSRMGMLKYLFSITTGAIAVAGFAAYEFWKVLRQMNEELDNTGKLLANPLGKMGDAMRKAMAEGATAAADFDDWLRKLAKSHDTLADKTSETIRAMREEADLRRQASGIKDTKTLHKMEQDNRKAELGVLNKSLDEQKSIEDKARDEASKADAKAFEDSESIKRKATLSDLPNQISKSEQDAADYKKALEDIRAQFVSRSEGKFENLPEAEQNRRLKEGGDQQLPISFKGSQVRMSFNDASNLLKQNQTAVSTLSGQQDRLAYVQKQLADLARDTKSDAEKQKGARVTLEKERDNLTHSIALHQKYDPLIEANEKGKIRHGHVSNLQQVGAYTFSAEHVSIARQSLHHLANIDRHLSTGGHGMGGGGVGRVNYGDHH